MKRGIVTPTDTYMVECLTTIQQALALAPVDSLTIEKVPSSVLKLETEEAIFIVTILQKLPQRNDAETELKLVDL